MEPRPREKKIKENLRQQGISLNQPYIAIPVDGVTHHAYPDTVCIAVLEYYAFEAGQASNKHAIKNYRLLARRSFKDFIYAQTGYDPNQAIPEIWRQFHDRVSLTYDNVPAGYFSIFKEVADIIVTLIRNGASVGSEFVPDISIGQHWAKHWKDNRLEAKFGARVQYAHNYPADFPQAASNPQPACCYPDEALGEFRRWIRAAYLPDRLPAYLGSKVSQGVLPPSFSEAAIIALASRGTAAKPIGSAS